MPISLCSLNESHEALFLAAVKRSRKLHFPWVAPPDTPEAFRALLATADGERRHSFLAVNEDEDFIGVINLNEIVRSAFQSAYLGYYVFSPFAGTRLMKQAMRLVIEQAFTHLKLHRLEANIQTSNTASLKLVQSLGFRHEGFSPRYLKIDGQWCDHERYAITVEDWDS